MGTVAPPPASYPDEPSNRWPWVALALGVLIIVIAGIFFFLRRPASTTINVQGTSTPNLVAAASSPSAPPTLVPPTLPPSATLAPSPTPPPSPTPQPSPTPEPSPTAQPTPPPPPPTQPPAQAAPPAAGATQPAQAAATPGAQTPSAAQPAGAQAPGTPQTPGAQAPGAAQPPAQPSATAFAGQVSNAGGVGNTRSDFDSAYGAPVGETPQHLVVYRKNNFEVHVAFVPDINGRAALIAELPQNNQAIPLEQAQAEAHKLLPKDAQPPSQTPEGNNQFVVERYTSQSLGQALPPEAFSANGGAPGQLMAVYVKDSQGRITRWIVGAGNDPNALISQGS